MLAIQITKNLFKCCGLNSLYAGIQGISGKDPCGLKNDIINAFVFISSLVLLMLSVALVLLVVYCTCKRFNWGHKKFQKFFLISAAVFLGICFGIVWIVDTIISFTVSSVLYTNYGIWKADAINCTSTTFYSGFAFLTVIYVINFGLVLVFFIGTVGCTVHTVLSCAK